MCIMCIWLSRDQRWPFRWFNSRGQTVWQCDPCSHPVNPEPNVDEVKTNIKKIKNSSTLALNLISFQIPLQQWNQCTWISNSVLHIRIVHFMWRKFLKFQWNPDLTLTPKSIPRIGRLCLPHHSAQWNICQHLLPQHWDRLPRGSHIRRFHIRLHWDEGRQFWGFSTDGKNLWKWQQCPCFHPDHSKPLEDQVRKEVDLYWIKQLVISFNLQILFQLFCEWPWISAWISFNKCGSTNDLQSWCMWGQFHNPKWHLDLSILPRQLPGKCRLHLHNLPAHWNCHPAEYIEHRHGFPCLWLWWL